MEHQWEIIRPRDKHNRGHARAKYRTARGLCEGYDDQVYAFMRDDKARTQAYSDAITASCAGKVVLDLGTGALALLAIIAAKAGARKVYAIEVNEKAYLAACKTVVDAGLEDVITVLSGYSTEVELPEKVEVLVHEIIGEIASQEGVVAVLRDALPRFGHPQGCLSIPTRVQSLVAPAMMLDNKYWRKHPYQYKDNRIGKNRNPHATSFKVWEFPARLLMSEPQPFEDIPFNEGLDAIPVSQERQMCFQVTRDGVFEGLVVHVELDLDVDRILSSSNYVTNGSHCSWDQIFVMTKERTQVRCGDRICVKSVTDLDRPAPEYTFEARVEYAGGELGLLCGSLFIIDWLQIKRITMHIQ